MGVIRDVAIIPTVRERYDEGLKRNLTFGNATPNPILDAVLLALPAFPTGD